MGDKCYHLTICMSVVCVMTFIALSIRIVALLNQRPAATSQECESNNPTNRPAEYLNHPCYIETHTGPIAGQVIDLEGRRVCQFIGIPYAEAPIGELRFMKTQRKTKWRKVIHETSFRASCPQTFPNWARHMMRPVTEETSEDCLYLNIWQPIFEDSAARKSIIVWIHGGGYQFGSGTLDETNGTSLAATQDVIVVTINYRLNAFGFLNVPGTLIAGNMGLYDQSAAIEWVHKNAAALAGDRRSITLWGQGMGAMSISAHIVSPFSRSKFKRAVMQTGSIFTMPMMYREFEKVSTDLIRSIDACNQLLEQKKSLESDEDGEEESVSPASSSSQGHYTFDNTDQLDNNDSLGEVDNDDESVDNKERGHSKDDESGHERNKSRSAGDNESMDTVKDMDTKLLSCLQAASTQQILNAVDKVNSVNPISFIFSPLESFFNNASPSDIQSDIQLYFSRSVKDLLFGFNSDEGTLLLNSLDANVFPDSREPRFNSTSAAQDTLLALFSSKLNIPKSILTTGINAAFSEMQSPVNNRSLIKVMSDFTGNNMFICPTLAFADAVSSRGLVDPENIHLFVFAARSEYNSLPEWFGTIHNEEVPLMFGHPLRFRDEYSPPTVRLSEELMKTVALFAKSGLVTFNATEWPPYSDKDQSYMQIDMNSSRVKRAIHTKSCNYFKLALDIA